MRAVISILPLASLDRARAVIVRRDIGTIVIENVLEKFSTAKVTVGTGVIRGHVSRFKLK